VLLVLIQQAELRVGILFTYFTETTFYFWINLKSPTK
jgi:hypothetical protein